MYSKNRFHGNSNKELVQHLKDCGQIKSNLVFDTMSLVDRKKFTTDPNQAYIDAPHVIAEGKTISSPHMHAITLELFAEKFQNGKCALDIGSGSGYLTTCMALALGEKGVVVGIECIPQLQNLAKKIMSNNHPDLLAKRITLVVGDGRLGFSSIGPYDIIHVGAAASEIPQTLINQLAPGGRLIMPLGTNSNQKLIQIDKSLDGTIERKTLIPVIYGMLIESNVIPKDIYRQCEISASIDKKVNSNAEIEKVQKRLDIMEQKINDDIYLINKKQFQQIENKIHNLENITEILKNKYDKVEKNISLQDIIVILQERCEKVETRVDSTEKELKKINNDLIKFKNNLDNKICDKKGAMNEISEQVKTSVADVLKDHKSEEAILKITLSSQIRMLEVIEKSMKIQENLLKEKESIGINLENRIRDWENIERRRIEDQMKNLENKPVMLSNVVELIEKVVDLQKLILDSKKVNNILEKESVDQDTELENVKLKINVLKETVDTVENTIKEFNNVLTQNEPFNKYLTTKHDKLEERVTKIEKELDLVRYLLADQIREGAYARIQKSINLNSTAFSNENLEN